MHSSYDPAILAQQGGRYAMLPPITYPLTANLVCADSEFPDVGRYATDPRFGGQPDGLVLVLRVSDGNDLMLCLRSDRYFVVFRIAGLIES